MVQNFGLTWDSNKLFNFFAKNVLPEPSEPFKMYIFEFSKLLHLPYINDFAIILAASSIVGSTFKLSGLSKRCFFTPAIWKKSKTLVAFRSKSFASITLDES